MAAELVVVVVVIAFDCGFFNGAVHPLYLTIRPGVGNFCEPVLNIVFSADPVKDMFKGCGVLFAIGELDSVIGENDVDFIGKHFDQIAQKLGRDHLPGAFMQLHIGELRSPVDGNKQSQLPLFCAYFGNIDVKIADRIAFEFLFDWLVAAHFRQSADPVARPR